MKKTKIYRKDYKESEYLISNTKLDFEFFDNKTIVTSEIHFYSNTNIYKKTNKLFLNGIDLELISILLDDNIPNFSLVKDGMWLKDLPDKFILKIKNSIYPAKNTTLNGLYKTANIFCTQCEAHGFSYITYYLDRPDILSIWDVSIKANYKKYPILLSNGNLTQQQKGFVRWHDPYPKPCYLFALVVGDLVAHNDEFVTKSGRKIILKIFTEEHNKDKTNFAMQSLKAAMSWDEERFNLEYDLDIYMIVAVDDFNMGAMENKGLNIFNSSCILANNSIATDNNYLTIEAIIAHEYFHNWTGNRVTCKDWFQLSLKEGLTVFRDQEFSSDMRMRSIKRIEDVDFLKTHQFVEDSSSFKHAVRLNSYIEMNNFYTTTIYEKGAEIVRMLHTILTEDGFQKGMQLYFKRFDGKAVDIEDFINSMSDANDIDLTNFMLWYDKAGTPQVDIKNDNNIISITQKDNRILPIKYGILNDNGDEITNGLLIVNSTYKKFDFSDMPQNCHFSFFRDFSAPIIFNYDLSLKNRAFLVINDKNDFVRFDNMQILYQNAILNNDETVFIVFDKLITLDIDNAIFAKLLKIPSEESLHSMINLIDVVDIHTKLVNFSLQVASRYKNYFSNKYVELIRDYKFSTQDIYIRELKNICLFYLSQNDDLSIAYKQFQNANCQTDKLASFELLLNKDNKYLNIVVDDFYLQHKDNDLVLDKWFYRIANAQTTTTSDIKKLLKHIKFNIKNPNRVMSLIGGFINNFINFHTKDGYNLIANIVIELNYINPQIAAKIVSSLTNFKKYTHNYADLQQKQLKRILSIDNLSPDVFEMITIAIDDK